MSETPLVSIAGTLGKPRIVVLSRRSNIFGHSGILGLVQGGHSPSLVIVPPPARTFDSRDFTVTAWATRFADALRNILLQRRSLRFHESIRRLCKRWAIPYVTQQAGSQADLARIIRREHPDLLLILGGWPELLSKEILRIPKISTVNLHPSLLPAFRGGDIHRWQIYHGVEKIGFSFHHVNEKFDAGEIILQEEEIAGTDLLPQDLSRKLAQSASIRVAQIVQMALSPTPPTPNPRLRPSSFDRYFPKWDWHDQAFFELDFSFPSSHIYNLVRSSAQENWRYPGFFSRLGKLPLIIRKCEIRDMNESAGVAKSGTIEFDYRSGDFLVTCGTLHQQICLVAVQIGGRRGSPQLPRKIPAINLRSFVGRNLMKRIVTRNGDYFG